jgi:hypothetical protein
MPIWISILETIVKVLIWGYGHKAVLEKVTKYTPLIPDNNPPPKSEEGSIEKHYGG